MYYLTVGTREIREDLFREIADSKLNGSIKPSGGLWLTRYDIKYPFYNEWVDYILSHPNILFYKNREGSPFCQPCAVVDVDDDAKIYSLMSKGDYDELVRCYGDVNGRFSFEELSKEWDGIYININSLMDSLDGRTVNLFSSFGVNSLILFRMEAILEYYPGNVMIDPVDYEDYLNFCFSSYHIIVDQKQKFLVRKKD